jgi:mannose-6-phosphate isomerase-like protein (cupin superfamily)
MTGVVNPKAIAATLGELWSPRVIGEVDEHYVKVAKVHGDLDWHSHANEDELFLVLHGRFRLEFEHGAAVELNEGDVYIVPKGVRHRPVAEQECLLMLFERKSTLHTGDTVTDRTRSIAEQLRPLGDA